jgi:hypothetical protein
VLDVDWPPQEATVTNAVRASVEMIRAVEGDNKRRARLNCIAHILRSVPYKDMIPPPLDLPPRGKPDVKYVRPPRSKQHYVPALKV